MATKKTPAAKKSGAQKEATGGRKYSPAASVSVEREMKAMQQGKLRSGSGARVTNPKQAIAIGLSEARREGDEAPAPPKQTTSVTKSAGAKKAAKKTSAAEKTATKKPYPETKAAAKKRPPKKKAAEGGSAS